MDTDDTSNITGLPPELGIDEELEKDAMVLRIRTETRRYGKAVTIVEGLRGNVDLDELASDLKRQLATGGTVDGDAIELQGDHGQAVEAILRERGFQVETA